jgi:hypothetical protein
MIFHVLVEGTSDEPTVREILTRRFGLVQGSQFQIHPHGGKGKLPDDPDEIPEVTNRTLLAQLPATLRAYSLKGNKVCVVVLVDQDDDDCVQLLADLNKMLAALAKRPANVLFRIAMEEIEAWFLADRKAVSAVYAKPNFKGVPKKDTDLLDDPSDVLAKCLGEPLPCTGPMKAVWAEKITPHLDFKKPKSPSLAKFIEGIERYWKMA